MFLSSITGAIFSIVSAIFITNHLLVNIVKLLSSISIITIAFNQTKKGFIFNLILLFMYTYAVGGLITSISSSVYYTNYGIITSSKINLWAITAFVIILTYFFEMIANHLKIKFRTNSFIYKLKLKNNNNEIIINAFLDTGNLLSFNGNPIIIVDLDCYLKLTNLNIAEFLTTPYQEIKTSTISGTNSLKLFIIEQATIYLDNKKINLTNQYIAVNTNSLFYNTNYKALLSPLVL